MEGVILGGGLWIAQGFDEAQAIGLDGQRHAGKFAESGIKIDGLRK